MRYEGNIYRPFSEANSYLLQCTIGCSHNKCTFCGMYKEKKYRVRSLNEIKEDIKMAGEYYHDFQKVFLCDGDAIGIDTEILLEILNELFRTFPSLRHVGTYAGPASTLSKSISELTALRAAGLTKAYLGVETGDDKLLGEIRKGVNYQQMLTAGQNLVNAGINLSAMILLGIAGPGTRSEEHAKATAEICNEMRPQYLAALTVTPVPATPLYRQVKNGEFKLLSPMETLMEMKVLVENISIDKVKFVGTHASNYLPVTGELQNDKQKILDLISYALSTNDPRVLRSEKMRGL
ncbi:MAG: radical SAM protein [Syntrophomonadaceae bacterium]|nr:radical SAM protein [Syntrophomonadaceae bacterium]